MLLSIVNNSPTGEQLTSLDTLDGTEKFLLFKPGVKRPFVVTKDKIVAGSGPATTFLGLSDTENTYTGQGGKILFVKTDGSGIGYKTIAEVSGVTADAVISALSYVPMRSLNGVLPDANGDVVMEISGGSWGEITGNIEDQTDLFQALEAKANDSEVVKTIETADGQILEMDENGKVILPDFSTEGGAETATDYIWETGDSAIFPVTDSSKVGRVLVNGSELRKTTQWVVSSPTEIEIINGLEEGWVSLRSGVTTAGDQTDVISYALSSPSADLAAGDTDSFIAPYNFTLNNYFAGVAEAPSGSALVVGLKKNGTSVTSSNAIIDSGETTSLTGTTPTITTNTFLKGDLITPVIQQVGALDTGKSLKIYLEITKS